MTFQARRVLRRRSLVGLTVLMLCSLSMVGCSKSESPSYIVLLVGESQIRVPAQPACVILKTCLPDPAKIIDVKAQAASGILVSVSKKLAAAGWLVAAYTTDFSGKHTPVVGAGTDSVHSTTTALVPVPAASIGSYTLQVSSVIPSSTLTSWIATIELTT